VLRSLDPGQLLAEQLVLRGELDPGAVPGHERLGHLAIDQTGRDRGDEQGIGGDGHHDEQRPDAERDQEAGIAEQDKRRARPHGMPPRHPPVRAAGTSLDRLHPYPDR
jgi:hypothetical protein